MIDTQARGRVSNSAANSLPTSENSAADHLGQIVPISRKVSTLAAAFWRLRRRFSLPTGKCDGVSHGLPRRSLGQASPSQKIKVGLKARRVGEADLAQAVDA